MVDIKYTTISVNIMIIRNTLYEPKFSHNSTIISIKHYLIIIITIIRKYNYILILLN